jgi:hypothetical protein
LLFLQRIRKTMGPDFIEDYTKSFKSSVAAARTPSVPARSPAVRTPPPPPARTAKKLNSILERSPGGTKKSAAVAAALAASMSVPGKLMIRKPSQPRPDACRECIRLGYMIEAFSAQDMMLRCSGYACHYAGNLRAYWNFNKLFQFCCPSPQTLFTLQSQLVERLRPVPLHGVPTLCYLSEN